MKQQNFSKGRSGEAEAREFLIKKGYEFIEGNHVNVMGELDLIMKDGDWLVFVEVKMKTDDKYGHPEEMISRNKLARVRRVAEMYLVLNPLMRKNFTKYRIDAVCIEDKIRHYENIY